MNPAALSRLTWRNALRSAGAICVAGAGLLGIYLSVLHLTRNFHVVVPGEVYRSAQPSAADIAAYKQKYGIRTIVNLRGQNTGLSWYDVEIATATKLGIAHVDFGMTARHELSQRQAAELIAILGNVDKPVLIHCEGGADRSGLASALYLAAVSKSGEEAAESQLSISFGHLSLPLNAAFAMDRTFEMLEPWLGFQGS